MFRDAQQELKRLEEALQQETLPFEETEQTPEPEPEEAPQKRTPMSILLQIILILCMALVVLVGMLCAVILLWLRLRGML